MSGRHLRKLIVANLWFYIEIVTLVYAIENGDGVCEDGLDMHKNNAGLSWCCENIRCDPGTEAQLCKEFRPYTTSCTHCKSGTFQPNAIDSVYMRKCQPHAHCAHDAVVIHNGSATTDVKCACNLNAGYHGFWSDCLGGKLCEPGYQLTFNGTCEKCPPNFYKNSSNPGLCLPCSKCGSETSNIASNCTAVSDTRCTNITHGPNRVEANLAYLITSIVLVFIAVIVIVMAIVLHQRLCRNVGNLRSSISGSSRGTPVSVSDPSIEQQVHMNDQFDAEAKEDLNCQCLGDMHRDTEHCLKRSSLCFLETVVPIKSRYEVDHHRTSDSEGLLDSPSDNNASIVDLNDDAYIDLKDERKSLSEENNRLSFQYEVEIGSPANDSLPSPVHGATVMNGTNNVQKGNIYTFNNCQNVTFAPPN